jgi:pimeloyl-ACP methyl ester carboxylesterase
MPDSSGLDRSSAKALLLATFLLIAGQTSTRAAPGDSVYTKPGQLERASDGARLNFYCTGAGSPTVVFDSGWGDWAPIWAMVQPRVGWTRACSYDRAGAGFSDAGPMPRNSLRIADELHSALHNAGIDGPYILVASSFGGNTARVFADRYMQDVAGLVFLESDTDDFEPVDMQEEDHRGQAGFLPEVRACRDAIAAGKPLPPLAGAPNGTCAQMFFRSWPEVAWSPELNDKLLQIAQTKASMYDAFISEMEQMPWDEAYLKRHRRTLGSRPIRVLSTGNHGVGSISSPRPTSLKHLRYEYEVTLAQSRLLKLSTNSKQIFTKNSSEYIQFDEPDTAVAAIREVYDQSSR